MYTVLDLTKCTGLTEREIRYLIGIDLLPKLEIYTKEHLYHIHQFIILKSIGLPLPHIQSLLKIKNVTLWKKYLNTHLTCLEYQTSKSKNSIHLVQLILNSIEIEGALVWSKIVKVFYGTLGSQHHFAENLPLKDQQCLIDYPEIYHSNQKTNMLVKIIKNAKKQIEVSYSDEREQDLIKDSKWLFDQQFPNQEELARKVWKAQKQAQQLFPYYPLEQKVLDYLETIFSPAIKVYRTS